MSTYKTVCVKFLLAPLLLMGLPIVGLVFSDQALEPYFHFPPETGYIRHAPFSWGVFFLAAALDLILLGFFFLPLLVKSHQQQRWPSSSGDVARRPFPWWGWMSLTTMALFWALAWTRLEWFAPFQPFTFTPLWLSFIVFINAHTYSRAGKCLLLHARRQFIILFVASVVFWWYFEFLNRFVDNWQYIGAQVFSPTEYAFHCTLAFSTVLPSVFSVIDWLHTFHPFRLLPDEITFGNMQNAWGPWLMLLIGAGGLLCLPMWPNYLFPFLWLAPFLLLLSIAFLLGEPSILFTPRGFRWRLLVSSGVAALVCGVFWEMWNFYSLAKWVYSIPFVDRFRIFEMPILGYGGYLPFGIDCVVAVYYFSRVGFGLRTMDSMH